MTDEPTTRLTPLNLSILADNDCPSDWKQDDLLEFAQQAAKRILCLEEYIRTKGFAEPDENRAEKT